VSNAKRAKKDTCKKKVLYYHLQKIIGNELKQVEPKETAAALKKAYSSNLKSIAPI
jgi:hypothetical protein